MKSNETFLCILIFATGFFFGILFPLATLIKFDPSINISDLLSILFTAAIGIYLGITITGRQSSSRFEKDFLISEIKKITDHLDTHQCFKNTEVIDFDDAKKAFKELNILIFNFGSILSDAIFCKGIETTILQDKFKKFRKTMLDLTPQHGKIKASLAERQSIITNYGNFRKEIFKIITNINSV